MTKAADEDGVTEGALLATRSQVVVVGHEGSVSKEWYVKLLRDLVGDVHLKHSECEAMKQQLDARVAKVEEFKLKVEFLADEAEKFEETPQWLNVQTKWIDSTKWVLQANEAEMKEKAHVCGRL